uniref:6-phosphofructokinase n=1 Tax=Negativibacillus massiliensis TaxID=1871035 RepID=UPI003AF6DE0B
TSESHDRCSVVEVMGHGAGHLALYASVACGGTACWVNEIGFDVDRDVIEKINSSIRTGKHNFIVIVSEGITDVHHLARYIEEKTGVESRATVLGHIQRGGTPTARDRIIASQMGCYAVDLLEQDIGNRVVIQKNAKIIDYDILEALTMKKGLDRGLLEVNQIINI